jgi:penicillin-binding protein 1C
MATADEGGERTGRAAGRRWRRLALAGVAVPAAVAGALAGVLAGALALGVLSTDRDALLAPVEMSRTVTDREGVLLRAFQTGDDRWRLPLSADAVDPLYLRMLLAYEDRRFHDHAGVDPRAVLRALLQAVAQGRIVSGASTLTMQTARLLMEEPTRSPAMKWRQTVAALALERHLDKRGILEFYLARAPFGGNIEGVRAASLAWFGKEPARLTPAQAALLVALPQAPEARRPDRHPEAARAARDRVLAAMEAQGVIDAGTAAAARREAVPTRRRPAPMLAPHATRQALARSGAGEVRLTLDARLQARLEAMVAERAARLGRNVSVALLVADHGSGEILAHVGSAGLLDEARRGHVDMTGAIRSPGSTLKPLIYGLAFEEGIAHPDSLIEDRPTTLAGYSPTNFDLAFQGTVRVRQALTASLNVPAVALLDAVGVSRFVARLRRAGAEPKFPPGETPGLAAALGGFGLSLRDLVQLYAGLARGGHPVVLRDTAADVPAARPDGGGRGAILAPEAAWRIGEILSEVPPPDTANGEGIAYKTGTSYGYRDAWAIGYDGRHAVGVWVGRADGTPVPGITGYQSAAPVLFDAFQRIGAKRAPLLPPPRALQATRDAVPAALRHARTATRHDGPRERAGPEIFFPPDGATVDLGLSDGGLAAEPLVIKARRGRGPYQWLANGAPVASGPFATALTWMPDGPGASVISVIDADGNAARITLTIR